MHPGTDLPAAWVAAVALAAVRAALALADQLWGSPWLLISLGLWVGLPVAVVARALVMGLPRSRPERADERADSGPMEFGLGIGLYTVPYVLGLATPWLGLVAALRLAFSVSVALALLGWALAHALSLGPDPPSLR